jgi:hypothetical protein
MGNCPSNPGSAAGHDRCFSCKSHNGHIVTLVIPIEEHPAGIPARAQA